MKHALFGCAILSLMSNAPIAAAQGTGNRHAFTDADLPSIVRVLETLAKARGKAEREVPSEERVVDAKTELEMRQAELNDIDLMEQFMKGEIDVLSWYRKHSTHVLIPPGARYDKACSAEVGQVALTFGVPAADAHRAVYPIDAPITEKVAGFAFGKFKAPNADTKWKGSPASIAAGKAFRSAMTFYKSLGFRNIESEVSWAEEFRWPDAVRDSLHVTVQEFDAGIRCPKMASGPVVYLSFDIRSVDTRLDSLTLERKASAIRVHDQVVARAGVSEVTVNEVLNQDMFEAQYDATHEDEIPSPPPPPVEKLDRDMELWRDAKEDVAIRKRNAAWYRRHAARLNPLFEKAGY